MKKYLIVLAAGETKRVVVTGRYFALLRAENPVDVQFQSISDVDLTDMNCVQVQGGLYLRAKAGVLFGGLRVSSAVAQTIEVLIGEGEGGTTQLPGVVSIIDGGRAVSISGSAFYAYLSQSQVAGQVAQVQLLNPSANKRILVEQIAVSSPNATAFGVLSGVDLGAACSNSAVFNKRAVAGAPATVCTFRGRNIVPPALTGGLVSNSVVNQSLILQPRKPWAIEPGQGLIVTTYAVATDVNANFDYYEENV